MAHISEIPQRVRQRRSHKGHAITFDQGKANGKIFSFKETMSHQLYIFIGYTERENEIFFCTILPCKQQIIHQQVTKSKKYTQKKKKQPDRFFEIHLCIIVYEPTFASFSKICGYSNFCKKKDNIITANQKERRRKQRTQPVI